MSQTKFIRVNGRIVPIKEKSYTGKKTVERDIFARAKSGASTGAKIGATFGAGVGILAGKTVLGKLAQAANYGLGTGITFAAAGSVLGAAFGSRKGQIKIKKKKFSSI